MLRWIPWSMTLGRVLFAPFVLWLAATNQGPWIALCIAAELILDIFDGIVARRLGVATSLLRRADSLVDTVFYLAVLYCAWAYHFEVLRANALLLSALLLLEISRHVFDYVKFRRESAYHMWSSKLWGLVLGTAVIALLGFGHSGRLLQSALLIGIVCDLEGLLISILLYRNVEDVPHFVRALKLRKEQKATLAPQLAAASAGGRP